MILQNDQLSTSELQELDDLIEVIHHHNESTPAVYKHLLMIRREQPSNFLYYEKNTMSGEKFLIGILSVFYFYEDACEISLLIHPQFRAESIDQLLFQTALPFIQKHGLHQVIISTSPDYVPPIISDLHAQLYNSEYHLTQNLHPVKDFPLTRFSVRPAQAGDLPQLCQLDQLCFPEMNNEHEMYARFAVIMTEPNYHLLVAEHNHQMIGKVHLRFDGDRCELSDFCIAPKEQHQGYGGELLSYALAYVTKQNVSMMILDVETKAERTLKLYTSKGFRIQKTTHFYKATLPKAI
jgi:N-acetylglutamate synthase-like GNAT family acetyltransferase